MTTPSRAWSKKSKKTRKSSEQRESDYLAVHKRELEEIARYQEEAKEKQAATGPRGGGFK